MTTQRGEKNPSLHHCYIPHYLNTLYFGSSSSLPFFVFAYLIDGEKAQ